MKAISLTQGQVALVDDHHYDRLARFPWCARKDRSGRFYAYRNQRGGRKAKRRLIAMHREIMNAPAGVLVDHRNPLLTLDNREENLRICNTSQNGANRLTNKQSKSGFKGVFWHQQHGRWRAQLILNRKKIHLGYFDTKKDAARAYDVAARNAFGEFARLNLG